MAHLAPIDEDQCITLMSKTKTKANCLSWITYENPDTLQACGTIVKGPSTDLISHSAITRYGIRECGPD